MGIEGGGLPAWSDLAVMIVVPANSAPRRGAPKALKRRPRSQTRRVPTSDASIRIAARRIAAWLRPRGNHRSTGRTPEAGSAVGQRADSMSRPSTRWAGRGVVTMAETGAVLSQLDIVAGDFDKTLAFYRRLGLDLEERPPTGGIRHAEMTLANGFVLHLDNVELAQAYNAGWRRPGGSSRALIGFSVATREAVDERYADLTAAGYAGRQRPYDTFWGARYAVVADPDGHDVVRMR